MRQSGRHRAGSHPSTLCTLDCHPPAQLLQELTKMPRKPRAQLGSFLPQTTEQ